MTRQEAVASYSNENISSVVKTAIAQHMQSFFVEAKNDVASSLLAQFGRGSTRYVVDKDFDPESDKTKVKLPVHKFFEEIQNSMPCIVVATAGCTFKPSGLGITDGTARLSNGSLTTVHHIMREIPIIIMVVTTSQRDTEMLAQTIQMMFGELSGITTGFVLHGHNDYDKWALHLPKVPEFSNPEKAPIGESVTQLAWSSTITLTTLFEDNLYLTFEDNKYTIGIEDLDDAAIDFPSNVFVGRRVLGRISGLRESQRVIVSDNALATLTTGEIPAEYLLLAKKPGTVNVQIVDGVDNTTQGSQNFLRPNIVLEKSIKISY
jgi:hypothetical protein